MSNVQITREYVTPELNREKIYYVPEADWNRIKEAVSAIIPTPALYQNAAWAGVGIGVSALLALSEPVCKGVTQAPTV